MRLFIERSKSARPRQSFVKIVHAEEEKSTVAVL